MFDQKYLKSILYYDPETGLFTWLIIPNTRLKFKNEAGHYDTKGYKIIGIDGKYYKQHRLAWLYMTGEWPKEQIDHANGARDDNRWCNLREATNTQNQFNKKTYKNNKLGVRGVMRRGNKFLAKLHIDGKERYIGTFDTIEKASEAYNTRSKELRGEFSNLK